VNTKIVTRRSTATKLLESRDLVSNAITALPPANVGLLEWKLPIFPARTS
jgi:hypothetical protein